MPTGVRCPSNNYITRCHRRLQLVSWSRSVQFQWQLGIRCPSDSQHQTEGWGPQWPTVEQLSLNAKVLLWSENLGQYVAVCPRLQLTSPTHLISTLSSKVREIYFYKEVCSFVRSLKFLIIVDYVSAYICICIIYLYVAIQQVSSFVYPCLVKEDGLVWFLCLMAYQPLCVI